VPAGAGRATALVIATYAFVRLAAPSAASNGSSNSSGQTVTDDRQLAVVWPWRLVPWWEHVDLDQCVHRPLERGPDAEPWDPPEAGRFDFIAMDFHDLASQMGIWGFPNQSDIGIRSFGVRGF
jgi:hypothetical protein